MHIEKYAFFCIYFLIKLEFSSKFSTGYYSESDQRKEKSAVLNIEEILMTEEKLSAVISCISNGITCEEECFDWFNSYFNTALSNYIEKYFIKERRGRRRTTKRRRRKERN